MAGAFEALWRGYEEIKEELKELKRSRDVPDDDGVLGDVDQNSPRRNRTKKSRQQKEPKKYFDGPVEKLSATQRSVRNQLAVRSTHPL